MRVSDFSVLIPQGIEREDGYVRMPHDTQYVIQLKNYQAYPADAEVTVDGRPVGTFRLEPHGDRAGRSQVTVETPPNDPGRGRFTFYKADTAEGEAAGAGEVERGDKGVVRVVFKPGKARRPTYTPPKWQPHLSELQWNAAAESTDYGRRAKNLRPSPEIQPGVLRSQAVPMNMTSNVPPPRPPAGVQLRSANTTRSADDLADAAAGVTGLSGTSDQRWQDAEPIDYDSEKEVTITLRLVAVPKGQAVRPLPPAPVRANPVPPPVS